MEHARIGSSLGKAHVRAPEIAPDCVFESRNREDVAAGKVARDLGNRSPQPLSAYIETCSAAFCRFERSTQLRKTSSSLRAIGRSASLDGLRQSEKVGTEEDRTRIGFHLDTPVGAQ